MCCSRRAVGVEEPLDEGSEGVLLVGIEVGADDTPEFASLRVHGCCEDAFSGGGEDYPCRSTVVGVWFSLEVAGLGDAVDELAGAADGDH